jgi:hypothetical protein
MDARVQSVLEMFTRRRIQGGHMGRDLMASGRRRHHRHGHGSLQGGIASGWQILQGLKNRRRRGHGILSLGWKHRGRGTRRYRRHRYSAGSLLGGDIKGHCGRKLALHRWAMVHAKQHKVAEGNFRSMRNKWEENHPGQKWTDRFGAGSLQGGAMHRLYKRYRRHGGALDIKGFASRVWEGVKKAAEFASPAIKAALKVAIPILVPIIIKGVVSAMSGSSGSGRRRRHHRGGQATMFLHQNVIKPSLDDTIRRVMNAMQLKKSPSLRRSSGGKLPHWHHFKIHKRGGKLPHWHHFKTHKRGGWLPRMRGGQMDEYPMEKPKQIGVPVSRHRSTGREIWEEGVKPVGKAIGSYLDTAIRTALPIIIPMLIKMIESHIKESKEKAATGSGKSLKERAHDLSLRLSHTIIDPLHRKLIEHYKHKRGFGIKHRRHRRGGYMVETYGSMGTGRLHHRRHGKGSLQGGRRHRRRGHGGSLQGGRRHRYHKRGHGAPPKAEIVAMIKQEVMQRHPKLRNFVSKLPNRLVGKMAAGHKVYRGGSKFTDFFKKVGHAIKKAAETVYQKVLKPTYEKVLKPAGEWLLPNVLIPAGKELPGALVKALPTILSIAAAGKHHRRRHRGGVMAFGRRHRKHRGGVMAFGRRHRHRGGVMAFGKSHRRHHKRGGVMAFGRRHRRHRGGTGIYTGLN